MQNMIEFEQSEPDAEILAEFKLSKPKNRIQENNQPDTDQPQPQVPITDNSETFSKIFKIFYANHLKIRIKSLELL